MPRRGFLLLIPLYNLVISAQNLRVILKAGSYITDPSSGVMMVFSLIAAPASLMPFFFLRSSSLWFARLIEANILLVWLFYLLALFLPQY